MKPTDPGYGVDPERGDLLPGDYAAFYRQALAWARDGAPPPVDPQDAVAALRILDAAARP
jgi:predicted dehydrogenase